MVWDARLLDRLRRLKNGSLEKSAKHPFQLPDLQFLHQALLAQQINRATNATQQLAQ